MTDNAKMVLEFGIRTLFDRRGNPMGRWCIHCNAYVTPDLDKSHVSYCPYAALAASEARVEALEKPRHQVRQFAELMEERLKANDHKGGWDTCEPVWLLKRLREETDELEAMFGANDFDSFQREAADVGNFAMMIADLAALAAALGKAPEPSSDGG